LAQRVSPAWLVFLGLSFTALGLGVLAALTQRWGLPATVFGMVLLGLGVSTVVTLGTDVVLTVSPAEKAGAASAISETGADLGGSFGVAVLGSVGAALYSRHLVLPAEMAADQAAIARETLGAALDAASRLPTLQSDALVNAARDAFLAGFQAAHAVGGVVLVLTAATFAWVTIRGASAATPTQASVTGE
jgi:DHA2 family multidrug resistance protein-like MFS transporter